jgi:double-stranded uracil-DNA glycosylase
MGALPDVLQPGLRLVICGTAAGAASAAEGAYYAGPGNKFWRVLHEVGLTPRELWSADYELLLSYGIGLTDLAKHAFGADADLPRRCFDALTLRCEGPGALGLGREPHLSCCK